MATSQTPKIAKGITQDMLVSVYKPIGTGENSEVFAGTIADLSAALNPGGLFNPVASDVTGSVTITGGFYSKAGKVVTMSFQFDGEAAAGTADIVFDFTLPVAAAFTNGRQLFGSNSSNTDLVSMIFQSNGDKGNIQIETKDVDQTVQSITVTIQYLIP